jgi:hypothetical protein
MVDHGKKKTASVWARTILENNGNAVQFLGSRELTWKAIGDRLQRPYHLSRVNHDWKIRNSWQWTDIGKYSFVNKANSGINYL